MILNTESHKESYICMNRNIQHITCRVRPAVLVLMAFNLYMKSLGYDCFDASHISRENNKKTKININRTNKNLDY
jgi:hypothetical protein